MLRRILTCMGVVASLSAGATSSWGASVYSFTKIADTTTGTYTGFSQFPVMNASGTVAFVGSLSGGGMGVFRGDGGALSTIADTSGSFTAFPIIPDEGSISVNSSGTVAFTAFTSGGKGIFAGSGGAVTTIGTTSTYVLIGGASINDAGDVAFRATTSPAPGEGIQVHHSGSNSTITTAPGHDYGTLPDINTSGHVVYLEVEPGNVARGVYLHTGGGTIAIAVSTNPFFSSSSGSIGNASVNDSDVVALWGISAAGGQGIFKGSGGALTTVADSSGPFSGFGEPSDINNLGIVAFLANLDLGGGGIYTGPDPSADKVVQTGDDVLGKTVTNLGFFRGFNDAGQVAFYAAFSDGSSGIFRADPALAPEPSSLTLVAIAVGLGLLRRRTPSAPRATAR